MPQFFIEKVKLWFGKFFVDAASIVPLLPFVPSDHPDSPVAILLFLARTLGVDFVQLFIGTYRFHRMLHDEDEK